MLPTEELILRMSAKTYTFNHLHLNDEDIKPGFLMTVLREAFRRITLLESEKPKDIVDLQKIIDDVKVFMNNLNFMPDSNDSNISKRWVHDSLENIVGKYE